LAFNADGGAITFDVPIGADGTIPGGVLGMLRDLGKDIDQLRNGTPDPPMKMHAG
jgi:hypothetical protein